MPPVRAQAAESRDRESDERETPPRLSSARHALPAVLATVAVALALVVHHGLAGQDGDGGRDPLVSPYAPTSIWNYPLGAFSRRVPLPVAPPTGQTLAVEEDLIVMSPDSPLRPVMEHDAGWSGASRCDSRTGRVLIPGVPVPPDFHTDPGYVGSTPNQAAAILMPDGSVLETQPLHVCPDGTIVSQFAPPQWRTGTLRDDGAGAPGAHGGSQLTALGGTIRLGEWTPGRAVIPHVLKIELSAADYLSAADGAFRWPARSADLANAHYGGAVPAARMGALLALPVDFPVTDLASAPAQILARTLVEYGAYVVDDTRWSSVALATEWGPAGRVTDEFRTDWGFDLEGDVGSADGDQRAFLLDLTRIYSALEVVDDNAPSSIGGAGPRLAPFAVPLEPG